MRNSDNSVPSRFPSETQLTEHQQEHEKVKHSKEQLPSKLFICEICGRALPKRKALKIHKNKVHGPKIKAQCNYCGKWYATRQHMLAHVYNMHTAADIEHRCDLCGFCASSPSALYQHKRFRHDPEKKHKCSVCDKSFKTRVQLKVSLKQTKFRTQARKDLIIFQSHYRSIRPPIPELICTSVPIVIRHLNSNRIVAPTIDVCIPNILTEPWGVQSQQCLQTQL